MLPDRVSNPGPLTYESGALPIALRGPALCIPMYLHCIYSLHILKDVSDFFIHLSCMHLSRSVQHTWVVSIYIFIVHVCHFERYICFFFFSLNTWSLVYI